MIEKTVSIGGRNFRIAVEDGQEDALVDAAERLDEFGVQVARSNPQIDSQYLLLMSGIMLASSLDEDNAKDRQTLDRLREVENDMTLLRAAKKEADAKAEASEEQIAALRSELAQAQQRAEEAVSQHNELQVRYDAMQSQLEGEIEGKAALVSAIERLENHLNG